MKRYKLFRILRQHRKLQDRRNPMWEQNRAAKVVMYVVATMVVLYLIFFGIIFAIAANDSETYTAPELMFGLTPFILVVDFLLRFIMQQTPSQLVKPYVLLPLPRYACTDCFLLNSLLSTGNLTWMAMLIPYALMAVVFSYGIITTLLFLLAFYLCIVINSQWYLLVRTLINVSMWWWLLAVAVYAIVFLPLIIHGPLEGISRLCDTWAEIGALLSDGNIVAWAVLFLVLAGIVAVNRRVQYHCISTELNHTDQTNLRTVSRMTFFNRWGTVGEFMKLEAKSIMRNKNVKKMFIFANAIVLMFSLLIALTDMYDTPFMNHFWSIYNFAIYGSMLLSKVMCYEGNYIECLMTRRDTIPALFSAKYLFNMAMMIVPFTLMIPTIIMGKCTLLQVTSIMIYTGGVVNCSLLYMALYNKQTMPLNTKFIGKGSSENNWTQVIVQLLIFFVPVTFITIGEPLVGTVATYLTLLILGVVFIVTHRWWLQRLYQRFMRRRHDNVAALIATR